MARQFSNANVGASGRRRIVPMMGIDFIAGDIKRTAPEYGAGGTGNRTRTTYGVSPANIGGRTRKWSNINFFQVNPAGRRITDFNQSQRTAQLWLATASQSSAATLMNPAVLATLQADWRYGTTYLGRNSNQYATMRGWVTAVRFAQLNAGIDIQPTTNTWPPQVTP